MAESQDKRVPILSRATYLNSCSQGVLSTDVRAAYEEYLASWEELGSPWDLWVEKTDEARGAFARLIRAEPQAQVQPMCPCPVLTQRLSSRPRPKIGRLSGVIGRRPAQYWGLS